MLMYACMLQTWPLNISVFFSSLYLVEKVGRLKMYALKRANLVRGRCRIFYINFLDYIPICKTSSLI